MSSKTKKIIICIVLVIVGLIAFECIIRALSNTTERIVSYKEIKKQEEQYMQTEEYVTETKIEDSIQKTMNYLSSGDYNSLYSVLDEEYKDHMGFKSLEDFETYLKDYLKNATNIRLIDFVYNSNRYICTVAISSESGDSNYTILVNPEADNSMGFSVILDDVIYLNSYSGDFTKTVKGIKYDLLHIMQKKNTREYSISLTNENLTDANITISSITLSKSNYIDYLADNITDIEKTVIAPKSTSRITANFIVPSSERSEDIRLDIEGTVNGEKFNTYIVLENYSNGY